MRSQPADKRAGAPEVESGRRLSARNQFSGRVSEVKHGTVMAEVTVDVQGLDIVAAITAASARNLSLQVDDSVLVAIKATEVMILK
ncbi:TOBE domain-containing protein [Nitrospira moscoviensis]|uniref:Molybdenum-pterin-binding protein 3 (Modular protein) n=1 Tax=Nitrospira moscoviensis TaxID=42253 RepID=A0A0K2GCU5_NITMO|nr:TOBE domain-containing protein [Nitrospira moscoviensis]ALA58773.1 Molybdenum-pterin-binding protein 3 (modular protein) [Nitrospira moscoviensis]